MNRCKLGCRRRALRYGLGALAGLALPTARGSTGRSVGLRLIVPAAPGTSPDLVARVVADHLQRGLGQPALVENKPGAIGTIGLAAVARAAPDGQVLGICSTTFLMAPSLLRAPLAVDLERDLKPVALVATSHPLLVVPARSPARTVQMLLQEARSRPGSLVYASGGNGTPSHLAAAWLLRSAGVTGLHVPYQGAATAAAVVAGDVGMYFGPVATLAPLIEAGRLRALATAAPRRLAAYPALPTLIEAGYPDVVLTDWQGIVAPAALSPDVFGSLVRHLAAGLREPAVRQRLEMLGLLPAEPEPAEPFDAFYRREFALWNRRVRDLGIEAG